MRSDVPEILELDARRTVTVLRHPTATWAEILAGTASDGQDLTPYVTQATQRMSEASLTVAWHAELYGASQPDPGDLIEFVENSRTLWCGAVESLSEYREERGTRQMVLQCRSRDAAPAWRDMRWASDIYPLGTDLAEVARDVLNALGLTDALEILLSPSGFFTIHGSTQLADLTAWDMLETIAVPLIVEPWIDSLGRFKWISRDVTRDPAIVLSLEDVVRIRGGRSQPKTTVLRLRWLSPALSLSEQQEQILGSTQVTAGFFSLSESSTVWFSQDHRQRASGSRMEVRRSINSGLIPFGSESYSASEDGLCGAVTVRNLMFVQALATASIAGVIAAHKIPDGVSTGYTIPVGRVVEGVAHAGILLALMCLGTGQYDVWGKPYDYVYATNTTEAYDDGAEIWETKAEEIANDYIRDDDHAGQVAIKELLYRSLSAQSWGVDVVDIPGLEKGDILELPDGARIYVTDYARTLTRGAPAVLSVDGFRV